MAPLIESFLVPSIEKYFQYWVTSVCSVSNVGKRNIPSSDFQSVVLSLRSQIWICDLFHWSWTQAHIGSVLNLWLSISPSSMCLKSCRNAIEELCMFKRVERRPMAWPCQLTIGSSLSIRIVGYKAVSWLWRALDYCLRCSCTPTWKNSATHLFSLCTASVQSAVEWIWQMSLHQLQPGFSPVSSCLF